MIIGFQEGDINNWKRQLQDYQKSKVSPPVEEKAKQYKLKTAFYAPQNVLKPLPYHSSTGLPPKRQQKYSQPPDTALKKYLVHMSKKVPTYDIITPPTMNESSSDGTLIGPKKNKAPIRYLYNILNGDRLGEQHLNNRDILVPHQYGSRGKYNGSDYDIINLRYLKNAQKRQRQQQHRAKQGMNKHKRDHTYDKIYNRYYDSQQQQQYWNAKKVRDIANASLNFDKKLPPTYQSRQRFILDPSKPLPEVMQKNDEINARKSEQHKAKYLFEGRMEQQNIAQEEKKNSNLKNRYKDFEKYKNTRRPFD